ncbi:GFA family protein [Woodsholea maritima]|uniref:GFA family protein n=1 Tax=Woodsholea maritima TaxID=240237 RepID=UPI00037F2145|nr:GFA family protein [Woodsholea maritima]
MSASVSHKGGCHCGAVRYGLTLAQPFRVFGCHCDPCERLGAISAVCPREGFTFEAGEASLIPYKAEDDSKAWQMCPVCGVKICQYSDAYPMSLTLNVRTLDNFSKLDLEITWLPYEDDPSLEDEDEQGLVLNQTGEGHHV